MTNTETPSTPSAAKPKARKSDITKIKCSKSHKYREIGVTRAVIVGFDTDKSLHDAELVELLEAHPKFVSEMSEGVWCLCDKESNASPPASSLTASIKDKGKVEVAGKVIPVPVTSVTKHLAYVDNDGKVWGHYFAVVYGRKRTRAARQLKFEFDMTFKVETGDLKSAAADMLIENLVRRSFSPIVEAEKLAKLAREGMSLKELAGKMGEHGSTPSDRTVTNKLKLIKLTEGVANMVSSGELGVTNAYAIADLPGAQQIDAARQVVEQKLTGAQTRDLVKEITGEKPSPGQPIDTGNLPTDLPSDSAPADKPTADDTTPESETKTPTFESIGMTKTKRPKAAEIEDMIEYLGGGRSPLAKRAAIKLAVAALHWVRGNMTDHEYLLKVAALHKCSVDDLAPTEPEPE